MARLRCNPEESLPHPSDVMVDDTARLVTPFAITEKANIEDWKRRSPAEDTERLYRRAQWVRAFRLRRRELLPDALFSEPAWDVLIELYLAHGRQRVSTTALSDGAGVAIATLLRWLEYLTQNDLVAVTKSPTDARMRFIDLTGKGLAAMTIFLRTMPSLPD